jgi:DNA mismatch repair ATPase MutL
LIDWRKQANKQTSKQANKHTSKHANKRTNKQPSKQSSKQTSKQANKQTSKQANKQTSKQANKQTSKQANKQPSNQTHNQPTKQLTTNQSTNKQTYKQPTSQPSVEMESKGGDDDLATVARLINEDGGEEVYVEERTPNIVFKVQEHFFSDDGFADELERWCITRCKEIDPDAEECRLEYTDLYKDFLREFENMVTHVIERNGSTIEEFYNELRMAPEDSEFDVFGQILNACVDFDVFLQMMKDTASNQQNNDDESKNGLAEERGGRTGK